MQSNRRTDTGPEVRLRAALHRNGLRFRKDLRIDAGLLKVRVDVVFTRKRVACFVDGCYWHRCPEHGSEPKRNAGYWGPKLDSNVRRDRRVDAALAAAGWTVIRVWEHEDPEEAAARVAARVGV
jgi:DNA mismatch endonuclease (patch repair protein)